MYISLAYTWWRMFVSVELTMESGFGEVGQVATEYTELRVDCDGAIVEFVSARKYGKTGEQTEHVAREHESWMLSSAYSPARDGLFVTSTSEVSHRQSSSTNAFFVRWNLRIVHALGNLAASSTKVQAR